jgi:hypothetical protein
LLSLHWATPVLFLIAAVPATIASAAAFGVSRLLRGAQENEAEGQTT